MTVTLVKVTTMILRDAISLKIHAYDICVSGLITFYIFDVNNDLSGVGINNSSL